MNIFTRLSKSRLLLLGAMLTISSCTGMLESEVAGPRGSGSRDRPDSPEGPTACPPAPGTNSRTDQIRLGLEPMCAGCHMTGDSGYFASLNAFESLLVRDTRLVSPGNPDASELVALLEGRRTRGSLTQMPISGDPFAVRAERGEADISIDEIRDWIANLEVPSVSTRPGPSVATVQRIGAQHIELGLRSLLGLTLEDFYQPAMSHGIPEIQLTSNDSFAVRSPDRAPIEFSTNNVVSTINSRFLALGGNSARFFQHEDLSPSTTFVQNFLPLSQAWCGMAIDKEGNDALFDVATPATGTSDPALLREQIADWHMLFLAERPTNEEIEIVIDEVFAPLEASSTTRKAWIGTCSYFIRHPLFVFY